MAESEEVAKGAVIRDLLAGLAADGKTPLSHRIRVSLSSNAPRLKDASRNSAQALVKWTRQALSLVVMGHFIDYHLSDKSITSGECPLKASCLGLEMYSKFYIRLGKHSRSTDSQNLIISKENFKDPDHGGE